jgi:hypothetical protein
LILSNPISHDLSALIGFTSFTDRTGNNNYTADAVVNGFPATFEPSNHKIFCRVYGTKELPQYLDASQVGELSRYGGVASSLENALFYTLTESGIDSNKIDPNTFQSLEENYALGFAIPETVSGGDTTWKEVIDKILQSTLCSIGFTNYGDGSAVIQAIQAQPFLAPVPTDFKMTEYDFNDFTFEHDYSGLFSQIKANFDMMEFTDFYGYSAVAHEIDFSGNSIFVSSRDLHEQENKIELNLLQYVQTEVNHIIEKYFVTLSERRGFYSAILSNEWILKAQIGREFQITRDNLPGAVENRQLKSVEVQKSTTGATITFEDQKGIQDNSGVW